MFNSALVYKLTYEEGIDEIHYYFVSAGKRNIVKAIQYKVLAEFNDYPVFNLGFGSYDSTTKQIIDEESSNNGDEYHVFNTVLSTIPDFFNTFSQAFLLVQGSDSQIDFPLKCRLTCKKNCLPDHCKNYRRRINIYRNYLHKHWNLLISDYEFFGGIIGYNEQMLAELYDKKNEYDAILILPRKN